MVEGKEEDKEVDEQKREQLKRESEEQQKQVNEQDMYYIVRFVQVICIGIAAFGALWKGTEVLYLDTPEFMMVYGGLGALISEIFARLFKKKILK